MKDGSHLLVIYRITRTLKKKARAIPQVEKSHSPGHARDLLSPLPVGGGVALRGRRRVWRRRHLGVVLCEREVAVHWCGGAAGLTHGGAEQASRVAARTMAQRLRELVLDGPVWAWLHIQSRVLVLGLAVLVASYGAGGAQVAVVNLFLIATSNSAQI
jgi:hypothetical protein